MAALAPDAIHGHDVVGIKIGSMGTVDLDSDLYDQVTGDEFQGIVKEIRIRTVTPDADIVHFLGTDSSEFDSSQSVANQDIIVKRQGIIEAEMTVDHNSALLGIVGMPAVSGATFDAYIGGTTAQYGARKTVVIKAKGAVSGKTVNILFKDAFVTLEGPSISADGRAEYTLTVKCLPTKYVVQVEK